MQCAPKPGSDRRTIAVLLAVFALLTQALFPAAAMAAQPEAGTIICTATGTNTAASGHAPSPEKGFAGMPCQDCLAAAMAAIATPELAIQTVAYAAARIEHTPVARLLEPRARAPPRPPGQGPPTA